MRRLLVLAFLLLLASLSAVCGGGSGDDDAKIATPTPSRGVLVPPLEGGDQPVGTSERTNFREHPEYQLPAPEDLPRPPDDTEGPEFYPPKEPECQEDWLQFSRSAEGFVICYPAGWEVDGAGYVTRPYQDRWYSGGVFLFKDGVQAAHVSVYTFNNYSLPYDYTRDCQQPYAVTLAGQPAVLCPDYPGLFPEERIVSYHVRTEMFDYLVNAVPYFTYDADSGSYRDSVDSDLAQLAIEVAHSFQLTEPVLR